MSEVSEWSETATATNDTAAVARAGEDGKQHFVTGIYGSFSAAAVQPMTLTDGATVLGTFDVHNQRDVPFERPVRITQGAAVELSLEAGGGGVVGTVVLTGYTVGA